MVKAGTLVLALLLALATPALALDANLAWTDNSTNEDFFEIEKKPKGGAYSFFAQVNKDVVAFIDHMAEPEDCYRVRAVNVVGTSGYSNEACVGALPADPTGLSVTVTNTTTTTTTTSISTTVGPTP